MKLMTMKEPIFHNKYNLREYDKRSCSNCKHYTPGTQVCKHPQSNDLKTAPAFVCDAWKPRPVLSSTSVNPTYSRYSYAQAEFQACVGPDVEDE